MIFFIRKVINRSDSDSDGRGFFSKPTSIMSQTSDMDDKFFEKPTSFRNSSLSSYRSRKKKKGKKLSSGKKLKKSREKFMHGFDNAGQKSESSESSKPKYSKKVNKYITDDPTTAYRIFLR